MTRLARNLSAFVDFQGCTITCGSCGATKEVRDKGPSSAERVAREQGWKIEWRPKVFIRCPSCNPDRFGGLQAPNTKDQDHV